MAHEIVRAMAWVDVVDAVFELGSRRAKRRVVSVVAVAVLAVPGVAVPAVRWYVQQQAERITERFTDVLIPPLPSAEPAEIPSQDKRLEHRPALGDRDRERPVDSPNRNVAR